VPRVAKVTNEDSTPGARSSSRFAAQADIGWLADSADFFFLRGKRPFDLEAFGNAIFGWIQEWQRRERERRAEEKAVRQARPLGERQAPHATSFQQ